jgi:hypothetical protein
MNQQRFALESVGAIAAFLAAMGVLPLFFALAEASIRQPLTTADVALTAWLSAAMALPFLLLAMWRLQDIIEIDPGNQTLTIHRRRLLIPDVVFRYGADAIVGVELREYIGEEEMLCVARVRMADRRLFAITERADTKSTEARAVELLVALGRRDVHPRLLKGS